MRKLFLSLVFMHVCMALEVFDKPMPNANLLIIGDASNLQLLNDNYVHVFDPKTKIKGYVRYDEFQKALLTSNLKKQYPQMSNILGKEEEFRSKAALLAENVRNKQAQLDDVKKRMSQRSFDNVLPR